MEHSSIQTTMRYAHLAPDTLNKASRYFYCANTNLAWVLPERSEECESWRRGSIEIIGIESNIIIPRHYTVEELKLRRVDTRVCVICNKDKKVSITLEWRSCRCREA